MNLFKDSEKMQRDWQIAGWNVTPKIKTREGESTRNNNEKNIRKAILDQIKILKLYNK